MAQTLRSRNPKAETIQSEPVRPNLPVGEMEQKHATPQKKSKPRKKRPRFYTAVRRSSRIKNTVIPSRNQNLQPVQIAISESESDEEEEPPRLEENVKEPYVHGEKTLVEKVDYVVQLLETMSSQGNSTISDSSELRYRSLYFESQKQGDALKKENSELSLKLQVALAKTEGFEKGNIASMEWMERFKDVILVTSLSKASEVAVARDPKAASSSKRMRG